MKTTAQIAKHLREVYFGGNWTASNLKDTLEGVTWQQAITPVYNLNTIAILVYHINYYVHEDIKVLLGGSLEAKDEFSFSHPPINSKEDWNMMLAGVWADGEQFCKLIEALPDDKMGEYFVDEKYGSYYRNLAGIVEHAHYHLGQIALLKKIIQGKNSEN